MGLITRDDLVETYSKLYQKGISFWLSRFHPDPLKRTVGTFNHTEEDGSFWWMVPAIRRRVNKKITGDENILYENYFSNKYLDAKRGLKLLSLGCGTCSHEMRFAQQQHFSEVMCVDIAGNVLKEAQRAAVKMGLDNMKFEVLNVNEIKLPEAYYDVVLFHSSLHHFRNIEQLAGEKIYKTLKQDGLLLINEYVGPNRLQFPKEQVKAMNKVLQTIPATYRKRYKSKLTKNSITGPGLLRMLVTDPSECVESAMILTTLHKHYKVLEEKPIGGNLLMLVYKDIAHHFMQEDKATAAILEKTFAMEDEYLVHAPPDQLFGVYQK